MTTNFWDTTPRAGTGTPTSTPFDPNNPFPTAPGALDYMRQQQMAPWSDAEWASLPSNQGRDTSTDRWRPGGGAAMDTGNLLDALHGARTSPIAAFVRSNMNNPGAIRQAMMQHGVGFDQIMAATGYTPTQVSDYVNQSGDQGLKESWQRFQTPPAGSQPAVTTTPEFSWGHGATAAVEPPDATSNATSTPTPVYTPPSLTATPAPTSAQPTTQTTNFTPNFMPPTTQTSTNQIGQAEKRTTLGRPQALW